MLCSDGHAERFDPPAGLECLLVVPATPVRTQKAREALPSRIPVPDAVFNIAHASLLVLGLARGDLGLVARGLGDRIHQPRRAHLYPRSWELVQNAKGLGALGATISGAGPTVLVWCDFASTGAVSGAWSSSRRAGRRSTACRSRPPAPTSARCDRPAARVHGLAAHVGPGAALPGRRRARAGAPRTPRRAAAAERSRPGGLRRGRAGRGGRRARPPRRQLARRLPRAAAGHARPGADRRGARARRRRRARRDARPPGAGRRAVGLHHAGAPGGRALLPRGRRARVRQGAVDRQRPGAWLAAGHGEGPLPGADPVGPARTSCCRGRRRRRATGARSTRSGSSSTASGTPRNWTSRSRRLS